MYEVLLIDENCKYLFGFIQTTPQTKRREDDKDKVDLIM